MKSDDSVSPQSYSQLKFASAPGSESAQMVLWQVALIGRGRGHVKYCSYRHLLEVLCMQTPRSR